MNFEAILKSEMFIIYLVSILISYILITNFSKNQPNKFEKPYDYYKYYVIDTSKDYIKIFLLSPLIFLVVNYLYKKNRETQTYNLNILSKIVEALFSMIGKIAKGYTRIE
jgi:uncharacterized membrane protein